MESCNCLHPTTAGDNQGCVQDNSLPGDLQLVLIYGGISGSETLTTLALITVSNNQGPGSHARISVPKLMDDGRPGPGYRLQGFRNQGLGAYESKAVFQTIKNYNARLLWSVQIFIAHLHRIEVGSGGCEASST